MDEMAKAWGFDGAGEFCHGGMLNAADCIAKDLYRHQVRERNSHPSINPLPLSNSNLTSSLFTL
jgi:hypothetical protein